MNCSKCVSYRVCFLQKSIKSLAERMVAKPFFPQLDSRGDRTPGMLEQHRKKEAHKDKLENELKEVIAKNCRMYMNLYAQDKKQEITNV